MKKQIVTLTLIAAAFAGAAHADRVLLVNTDFSSYEGWIAGTNKFRPKTTWIEFVQAPDAYSYESRVVPTGSGFVFNSWDDLESDRLENYLFQEFGAGPAASSTPTEFATGEVIVFKGSASATRTGNNTSDMIVRAFIKVLGYNNLGWAFQTKQEYSAFHPIGSALEPFELRVTFPDLTVDDSLQVLQIGFEITNEFDGTAMDAGTIYFENISAYVEGGEVPTWGGYPIDENGFVDTGDFMGPLYVSQAPWIYVYKLSSWALIPEGALLDNGAWTYVLAPAAPAQ